MNDAKEKTCCFTGHRPEAFPWGNDKSAAGCKELLKRLDRAIAKAIKAGYRYFITGNALGVDTWAAELVLKKKKAHDDIVLEVALPFEGHNGMQEEVKEVLAKADVVKVVSAAKPRMICYHERNRYMVDKSALVIAVYDEYSAAGGTLRTVQYAKKQGVAVEQIPWGDIAG